MRVTLMTMQDASALWWESNIGSIDLYIEDHLGMFSLKVDQIMRSDEDGDFVVLVPNQGIYVPNGETVQVVYHD